MQRNGINPFDLIEEAIFNNYTKATNPLMKIVSSLYLDNNFNHNSIVEDTVDFPVIQCEENRLERFERKINYLKSMNINVVFIISNSLEVAVNRIAYKRRIWKEDVKPVYTAEMYLDIITKFEGDNRHKRVDLYNMSNDNDSHYLERNKYNEIVWVLCLYFANDIRFETEYGYSLAKGIWLEGGLGVGKTHLMNAFTFNQRLKYTVKEVKEIRLEYNQKDNDLVTVQRYSTLQKHSNVDYSYCFNDFGKETNLNKFGNMENVLGDILERCEVNNLTVHVTTNAGNEQIYERYGDWMSDRFAKMFNQIIFPKLPSRRI